jgi:hypothetical protein
MRGKVLAVVFLIAAVCSSAASAAPGVPRLPPEPDPGALPLENLGGHLDMYIKDQAIVVALRAGADGAVDRQFTVEVGNAAEWLPSPLHSDAARIVFWTGHLVVIADGERRVFHFSVAGFDPPDLSSEDVRPELLARAQKVDPSLASKYSVARITGAHAIISSTPAEGRSLNVLPGLVPGLAFLTDCCDTGDYGCCVYYQDFSGGGSGGCAASCSVKCQDGTSCNASCGTSRCARCSCTVGAICSCE